ncbi:Unknown protein, partial [Striga hermonthica]
LFCVDKVVLSVRSVPRTFPVFKSWSIEALRARERDEISSGAFGRGFMDVDFCMIVDNRRLDKVGQKHDGDVASVTEDRDLQAYVQEFASKTRLLATTGIQILQLVEKAPQVLLGDGNFAKMHDAAQKILGVHSEVPRVKPYHPGPSQHRDTCTENNDVSKDYEKGVASQLADDVFWNDPDTLVMIDEIMKAVEERDHFMRMQCDVPSFSLGLSSDDDAGDVAESQHTSDNGFKQPGRMQPEVDVQKVVLDSSDKTTRTIDKTPTIEVSGLVPDQCVTT